MRVHHLNCATLCPVSARLVNGVGGLFSSANIICHCLLIETNNGLILIDTGLGTHDLAHPGGLGFIFRKIIRPQLSMDETAVQQVRKLGYRPEDVRHIILTHLDLDHAGGLSDFPSAAVHVSASEYNSAMAAKTVRKKFRYHKGHWSHNPKWNTYPADGDKWFGFEAVRAIDEENDIFLVPLNGHTDGHCGVAVKTSDKWIFHCGDAYFFHGEILDGSCTTGLKIYQNLMDADHKARMNNQQRLRELSKKHIGEIQIFCSHDATELHDCKRES